MIPALVANPPPETREPEKTYATSPPKPWKDAAANQRPSPLERVSTAVLPVRDSPVSDYDEDSYILRMLVLMFVVLVLPGLIALAYLIFSADALMYDITPNQDF